MQKCERLGEYSYFVASVRNYLKEGCNQKEAVTCAVNECIEKGILKDVLEKHRAEVVDMFLTTFDRKMYEEALREEGREELEKKYEELSKDHAELSKDHAELSKQLEAERKRNAELEALLAEKIK